MKWWWIPAGLVVAGYLARDKVSEVVRSWLWPVIGTITDRFGWRTHPIYGTPNMHDGIDIAVPSGTPIRATYPGTVSKAGWHGGYGIAVILDHGGGVSTLYGHLSEARVLAGQVVDGGTVVGLAGSTGNSTGPHLHFSVYVNGEPVDPASILPT